MVPETSRKEIYPAITSDGSNVPPWPIYRDHHARASRNGVFPAADTRQPFDMASLKASWSSPPRMNPRVTEEHESGSPLYARTRATGVLSNTSLFGPLRPFTLPSVTPAVHPSANSQSTPGDFQNAADVTLPTSLEGLYLGSFPSHGEVGPIEILRSGVSTGNGISGHYGNVVEEKKNHQPHPVSPPEALAQRTVRAFSEPSLPIPHLSDLSDGTETRSLGSNALSFGRISLNPNASEFVPGGPKPDSLTVGPTNISTQQRRAASPQLPPSRSATHPISKSLSGISTQSDEEYKRYWQDHLPDELITFEDQLAEDHMLPSEYTDMGPPLDPPMGYHTGGFLDGGYTTQEIPSPLLPDSPRGVGGGWGQNMSPHPQPLSPVLPGINGPPPLSPAGYISRFSPHPSPLLGPHSPYNQPPSPGGGVGRFHSRGGALSPMEYRPGGPPPPFELPPGPTGVRERPFLPPWGGEGYEVGEEAFEDPVAILAAQFPNFSVDTLADLFFGTGGDLHITLEMLAQLELQEEGARSPRYPPAPSLTSLDFPALTSDGHGGVMPSLCTPSQPPLDGHPRRIEDGRRSPFQGNNGRGGGGRGGGGGGGKDFAAAVRKHGQQSQWQYEHGPGGGMEREERVMAQLGRGAGRLGMHRGEGRDMLGGGGGRQQPWLETGDAVGHLYAELREDARDHARVRNLYFEQATKAYLKGNKAEAKELGANGQYHNAQMKAAHDKAGEAIFRQRNMASGYLTGGSRGDSGGQQVLDLHGLHVNEALSILRRELAGLKRAARTTGQRQQIMVCVGTGHHTKGRAPPRLSTAVERLLSEEEGLPFSETQPGMLHVFV